MRRRSAYSLLEIVVAFAIATILIGIVYGLFHMLMSGRSRSNLRGLTSRSYIQKDAKAGVRRLVYRLREGIQILSPAPGSSSDELVFRDILNRDVRLRLVPGENTVVSERRDSGSWVRETGPTLVPAQGGTAPMGWPVTVLNCSSIRFTALSGDSVTVQATVEWEGEAGSLLTVVKLRNTSQAY